MTQTDQTAAQRTLRKPHRQHSIEFKRAVAEQALQQGACITHIAREHDIRNRPALPPVQMTDLLLGA